MTDLLEVILALLKVYDLELPYIANKAEDNQSLEYYGARSDLYLEVA